MVSEGLAFPDPTDSPVATIGLLLLAVALAVIVIPLLLFGIELIVLGFAIAAGIAARGLLGRPWVVQARRVGAQAPALIWLVTGWRGSRRLIEEVAAALAEGREPTAPERVCSSAGGLDGEG